MSEGVGFCAPLTRFLQFQPIRLSARQHPQYLSLHGLLPCTAHSAAGGMTAALYTSSATPCAARRCAVSEGLLPVWWACRRRRRRWDNPVRQPHIAGAGAATAAAHTLHDLPHHAAQQPPLRRHVFPGGPKPPPPPRPPLPCGAPTLGNGADPDPYPSFRPDLVITQCGNWCSRMPAAVAVLFPFGRGAGQRSMRGEWLHCARRRPRTPRLCLGRWHPCRPRKSCPSSRRPRQSPQPRQPPWSNSSSRLPPRQMGKLARRRRRPHPRPHRHLKGRSPPLEGDAAAAAVRTSALPAADAQDVKAITTPRNAA